MMRFVRLDSVSVSPEKPHLRRLDVKAVPAGVGATFWERDAASGQVNLHLAGTFNGLILELRPAGRGFVGQLVAYGDIRPTPTRITSIGASRVSCDSLANE